MEWCIWCFLATRFAALCYLCRKGHKQEKKGIITVHIIYKLLYLSFVINSLCGVLCWVDTQARRYGFHNNKTTPSVLCGMNIRFVNVCKGTYNY